MLNRTTSIFIVGGLLNAACLGYVLFGLSEGSSLETRTRSLSNNIHRLEQKLPDPSRMMALSNKMRILNEREDRLKRALTYEFGDVMPDQEPDSPEVLVGDQISLARDRINDLYSSSGRSLPDGSLGLPDQPTADRYREQLRQIQVAKHLHRVLLNQKVDTINGISQNSVSPDHRLLSTLDQLEHLSPLAPPLTISFNASLNNVLAVLHTIQNPGSYLQILSLNISARSGETAGASGDLLLEVKCTVAPVYSGKPEPGDDAAGSDDASDDSTAGDDEDDDGSSFFND